MVRPGAQSVVSRDNHDSKAKTRPDGQRPYPEILAAAYPQTPARASAALRALVRHLARQAARKFLDKGSQPTKTGRARRLEPANDTGKLGETNGDKARYDRHGR